MNKNLLALFLASLTLSLPLVTLSPLFVVTNKPGVRIDIQSNADVSNIVSAITNLHRPGVILHTERETSGGVWVIFKTYIRVALAYMATSALVGVLYKFYCKRLGIIPTI